MNYEFSLPLLLKNVTFAYSVDDGIGNFILCCILVKLTNFFLDHADDLYSLLLAYALFNKEAFPLILIVLLVHLSSNLFAVHCAQSRCVTIVL